VVHPLDAAHALRRAHLGAEAEQVQETVDEMVGYMIVADIWQALDHLREAYTKSGGG
jgi:hypothetical protein